MKNKAILLLMALVLFYNTIGVNVGSAKAITPDQLVGKSEAYARQLAANLIYEKNKSLKPISAAALTGTKTSIGTASVSVKKLKSGTIRKKLEARLLAVGVVYNYAISFNAMVASGEGLKAKAQNLASAYAKNPSSDSTESLYQSLVVDLVKFTKSISTLSSVATRNAMLTKYKVPADTSINLSKTAVALKGELKLFHAALNSGKNEAVFNSVDRFNAQLGKVKSNPTLFNAFAAAYKKELNEKGLSTDGLSTIILKKIIANEKSVVYLEVYDKNNQPLSQGSGFIVGKSTILTNFHVVQDGYRVVAYNNDGKEIGIRGVVQFNPDTDLALLGTVNDLSVPALQTGNSDYLEKGDSIVTIGSPEGLMNTISTGIISGFRKEVDHGITTNLIQITAPITHGSSGGALFNEYGEVIGVTSSGFESGNLNFAVDIKHADLWIQTYKSVQASMLPIIPYSSLPPSPPDYGTGQSPTNPGNPGPVTPPVNPGTPGTPGTPVPVAVTYPISSDKIVLGTKLRDVVMNPNKPILYGLSEGKDVIEINLATKQARKLTLNLPPERLFFANNELYVTLLKGQHSYYWYDESQQGAFAVISADSMTVIDQVDIQMDPFDIVADANFIYLSSGSGQWTTMKAFSRKTLLETANVMGVRQSSYLEIHPDGGKVYSIDTDSSPRDVDSFQFASGKSTGHYDSPYHGDYPLNVNMDVSPDGQFLFNGSGVVFNSSVSRSSDLTYVATLPQSYEEIAFDLKNNRFYTSSQRSLEVYDYSTFGKIKHYDLPHEINQMFVKDGQLIVVYKEAPPGTLVPKQIIKKYPLTDQGLLTLPPDDVPSGGAPSEPEQFVPVEGSGVPQQPKAPLSMDKAIVSVDLKMETMNPTKPILYGVTGGKDLVQYNYATKETKNISLAYPVGRIFFANNEIYVALKKQQTYVNGQAAEGAFAVVDAETFTLIKQQDIPMDPFDIVADSQSIYISNGGGSTWTNLKAYSRSTYEETGNFDSVLQGSYLIVHPDGGKVYSTDNGTSPRDIQTYEFSDGKNVQTYDSPYHGDYPFTTFMKISPDGKFIFNGSGVVLQASQQRAEDMKFVTKLDNPFEVIAFDLSHNRFYTSSKNVLDIYDYSTLERIKHYELAHSIDFMAVKDNNLIITYKEAPVGTLLPKKTIEKYPLTDEGTLTMQ